MLRRPVKRSVAEITELHTFGWGVEQAIQPVLESILGETLQKTARRYDAVDFVSASYQVELKSRRAKDKKGALVTSKSFPDWLLPASKIRAAERSHLRTVIFYYYEGDQTLWMLFVDEQDWSEIPCRIPWFHTDKHYYVPANLWKEVDGSLDGIPFSDSYTELPAASDSQEKDTPVS